MESYVIRGGHRLHGMVQIHGAKNSVLPILAACICCSGVCEIYNCPNITDVDTSEAILRHLGCTVERVKDMLRVDASTVIRYDIPSSLMQDMRSSVLFLGALLMRCGEADLVEPGGCALGQRPIDLHLWAMEQLGAKCEMQDNRIVCRVRKLRGQQLTFRWPSVGATENAILAALGCEGETTIRNAAREPEIMDLVRFLRQMGARITGEGTPEITVQGGRSLCGTSFTVMPDRIETATYLCAAAGCGGEVYLSGAQRKSLESVLSALGRMGCSITEETGGLRLISNGQLHSPGYLETAPYPGFPTDAQAPVMATALRASGITAFTETIFENRFRHVPELQKLGADIQVDGQRAVVQGVALLRGAEMKATDLRCGAALVIAALQAQGESTISGIQYINRGYESLAPSLRRLGADIRES